MFRLSIAAALAATACGDVSNDVAVDPATKLDETVFRCSVEPILARQCSYTACHGIEGAALRVYTPGKLRATPPTTIDEALAKLTDAEHHSNFTSASGFSLGFVSTDNFLLRKPLPAIDGGYEHKGGAIYSGVNDPQYQAISAWLSGNGVCP